jgi:ankyrin repeat protein
MGVGQEVMALDESLTMDLRVEQITDTTDYQIFDAFKRDNLSRVLDLVDSHVGVNAMDEYGQTPLMMAVSKQYLPVIASLLNTRRPKVDVNAAKSSGFTAIFYAVERGTPTILQALLRRGADPNAVILQESSRGNTPLHYACMLEKVRHAELLLEYGADPLAKNKHGQMPLQMVPTNALRTTKIQLKTTFEAAYEKMQQRVRVGSGGSPRQDI